MLTDHIANFLTRLRNVSRAGRKTLRLPSSYILKSIANLLAEKSFIASVEENTAEKFPELIITLQEGRDPLSLKRISKPGQRIYVGYKEIKRVKNGLGISIISTSAGIMTGEEAKAKKLGGEYICEVS